MQKGFQSCLVSGLFRQTTCIWIRQRQPVRPSQSFTISGSSSVHSQHGNKNSASAESEGRQSSDELSSTSDTPIELSGNMSRRLKEYKEYQRNIKGNSDVSWVDKVVYSSYLQQYQPKRTYGLKLRENALKQTTIAVERVGKNLSSAPLSWKYLEASNKVDSEEFLNTEVSNDKKEEEYSPLIFPFQAVTKLDYIEDDTNISKVNKISRNFESEATRLSKAGVKLKGILDKDVDNEFDHNRITCIQQEHGNPDPSIPPSKIPCGGCGARLHCQDSAIPGYIPSERFKMLKEHLRGELCLRCYCLKNYNTALNVNVGPEDYAKVLRELDNHFAMVLLVVDLTDFPCSIWPGLIDIIGTKRPVFLVGNKVDLIPRDSQKYLQRIEDGLIKAAKETGLASAKVVHTSVISATTGFGVEDLITRINSFWGPKGDVFIMGCTNVGKSSLFNSLIQSDFCKPDVADLIQKATISQWPGTTLNLLKFPIMRTDPWKNSIRKTRLGQLALENLSERSEKLKMLRTTKDPQFGVLTGTIGRSMLSAQTLLDIEKAKPVDDPFRHSRYPPKKISPKTGEWDPEEPTLQGKWCYDTPGVVNENQILDIFTLPELMQTLPKKLIEPRTYFIQVGMSLFVGGFARIDYINGLKPIRYTVYCSDNIPITIVQTSDASNFYKKALGTRVLGVPEGNSERLSKFPSLSPTDFSLMGEGHRFSCGDIVLSSAGWVAVTAGHQKSIQLRVHAPGGRGIYLRQPSILPYAVCRKGGRIRGTLAYLPHKVYVPAKGAKI